MPPRKLPVTVIIPTRNEAENLPACLRSLRGFDQIIVVDSASSDDTREIACSHGAEVLDFVYTGGWPKKRQWALENAAIRNPWTLLLDADERMTRSLARELARIVRNDSPADGYWVPLRLVFLGRELRHGASGLRKLSFFRTGRGRFERLLEKQDPSMADMEIHEHVIVDGREATCRAALRHENVHRLDRYIAKHNEYSNWSAALVVKRRRGESGPEERRASLSGAQADRRRAVTNLLWKIPAGGFLLPIARFLWFYLVRLGFLDGAPGFYYCGFKAVQAFHIMAKVREQESTPPKFPVEHA